MFRAYHLLIVSAVLATVPGSAFNPSGNAGTHYAGTQPQNSKNPKSVSQYDVAGFQQSHKPN